MSSEGDGNAANIGLETAKNRNSSRLRSSLSSAMMLASNRQMRQSQYDAVIMGCSGVSGCSLSALEKGNGPCCQFSDMVLISRRPGTTPGVFGNRALTFFEQGRIPRTCGRKSGPASKG